MNSTSLNYSMEETKQITYLDKLQRSLETSKELLDSLHKRKQFLHSRQYDEDTLIGLNEQNESKITIIDTQSRIDTLTAVIREKEVYFKKFAEQFDKDVIEMNLKYDSLLQKAKEIQHKNDAVNWLMTNAKFENLEISIEAKVHFYKRLKDAIK